MALCPYCFKKINLHSLDLRCASSICLEPGTTERHIIPRRSAKVDRKGFGTCDRCGKITRIMVCSHCRKDLPDTIGESETKIVSIVGAKGSGKSYYVATLLHQMMDKGLLARIGGIAATFLPGSREIYQKRYKDNLDSHIPIASTNYFADIVKDNPPVLVQMTYMKKKKKTDNTYSFFDAAGESFKDPSVLAAVTPYIAHSEAILIILDPRQLEEVNRAVTARFPGLPLATDDSYSDTIMTVAKVVRNSLKLKDSAKIPIPLCVAFSKWDLLINTPGLLPDGLIVSTPSMSSASGFDLNIIENSSGEIRSLLNRWDPSFLTLVESNFKEICYFGFSAWGMGSSDGKEVPAIASFRVEDPLLWVLNKNKVL